MTVRIVMGTSKRFSGKEDFIKKNFQDATVLNVGDYQRKLVGKAGYLVFVPIDAYKEILVKANDLIKKDMVEMLHKHKIL